MQLQKGHVIGCVATGGRCSVAACERGARHDMCAEFQVAGAVGPGLVVWFVAQIGPNCGRKLDRVVFAGVCRQSCGVPMMFGPACAGRGRGIVLFLGFFILSASL